MRSLVVRDSYRMSSTKRLKYKHRALSRLRDVPVTSIEKLSEKSRQEVS